MLIEKWTSVTLDMEEMTEKLIIIWYTMRSTKLRVASG